MRVLHITDDLAETSGVVTFLRGLIAALEPLGVASSIMVAADRQAPKGHFNVVHLHGMWLPVYHRMYRWAKARRIPVVWSPHGMLTPWAMHNHGWKKWPYWHLIQKWDMRGADVIHVTAKSEELDLQRLGLTNRMEVIPLGVDVPIHTMTPVSDLQKPIKTILFVSRIQKKKGLPMLLEAWAKLLADRALSDGWRVVIAGPDEEDHVAELKTMAKRLHLERVEFIGPVLGEAKDRLYRQSDIFVLPTHSENFGSVVIESLANETPVVCTKGAPWEELETHQCGRWCDISVEAIASALRGMMSLSDSERHEMGVRGRKLVEEKYTWAAVGKAMKEVYEGVLK